MSHQPKGRYTSFESVLHELLHKQLDAIIAEYAENLLLGGSARKATAADTAAAYYEAVGFAQGLRRAQEVCKDIAQQLSRDG